MTKGCRLIKCPNCGYEMPPEPKWLKKILERRNRDYGAAGLYDLNKTGILSGIQLLVACIALTLFLPCIAQLLMIIKERGAKTGICISLFVLLFSFTTACAVNYLLVRIGVVL